MNGKFSESNESLTAVRGKHIQFKLDIKKTHSREYGVKCLG